MTATECIVPNQTITVPKQPAFAAPRALVIEDHAGLAGLLGEVFARNGIDTDIFSNGAEALLRLRVGDGDYGMVCSDVELPGASGWTVLEWVQTYYPDLPIMLMSGTTDPDFVGEAMRRGAVAAFRKPFSVAKIQQTLTAFFPYV